MNLFFCSLINAKVFNKLIVLFCLFVARHTQSTQNNEFTISLQYLKKEVSWFDFLHADKYGSFLQIDSVIFDADGQAFPKFPK